MPIHLLVKSMKTDADAQCLKTHDDAAAAAGDQLHSIHQQSRGWAQQPYDVHFTLHLQQTIR